MTTHDEQLQVAIERIDAFNRDDPNVEAFRGETFPKELLYARRMTHWLERLAPDASDALRLAARSQHIGRWTIPRDRYPMNRPGYLKWRKDLGRFHAETAGRILRDVGYDDATVERVRSLLRKERLKQDPETQLLEDVICLVFLESYFSDFSRKHDEAKLIVILRKTWQKMSDRGREAALGLQLDSHGRALLERALADRE